MKKISVPEQGALALFGINDENLKSIEKSLDVKIVSRGSELMVEGDPARVEALENEAAKRPSAGRKAAT